MDSLRGDAKDARFRAEYLAARTAARDAVALLLSSLDRGTPLAELAERALSAQMAAARLHTAVRCILSPP